MKLYLIDGYGFVFRAYHSLPPLYSQNGIPVAAVYGFINMLVKLLDGNTSEMIAVALDSGSKNFRHSIFPNYKAQRPTPPDDLIIQFPIIREAVTAFNLKILEQNEFEADDIIATYARAAVAKGYKVIIVATDKDLMQLISPAISIYDPIKQKEISRQEVINKFGVEPEQLIDALALIGDASDNIPGVKGIGPKTAAELLKKYNSLQGIYDNLESIESERIRKTLLEHKEISFLSQKLVTLSTEAALNYSWNDLKAKLPEDVKLAEFLSKYGFKSLLQRFRIDHHANQYNSSEIIAFTNIPNIETLSSKLPLILKNGIVAIYVTNNILYISSQDEHYTISFSADPSNQDDLFNPSNKSYTEFKSLMLCLKDILESTAVRKILINSKELLKILWGFNINLYSFDDVSVLAYSLETGKYKYTIEELALIHLGTAVEINSHILYKIYEELCKKTFLAKQYTLYETIEKPLIRVLANMEIKGVKVDPLILKTLSKEFEQKLTVLASKIYSLSNEKFNIASPKQIGNILFEKMKISGGKKSKKTQSYITDSYILEQLAEQGHEIAELILEWRQLTKLINTYTDSLQKAINPYTKRIHTTFEMTATSTGRLSSHNPNLQNIPIKSEEGNKIRQAFTVEPSHLLISVDYSQIELRLLAHIANIIPLKKAFISNQDIHAATASQIFGVDIAEVDYNLRRKAKAINFGIIYGISAFGLAKNLDIKKEEAKNYIAAYFKKYPGIQEYMQHTIEFARKNNFVKTLLGRKCYIQGLHDKNHSLRTFAERAAINAPLQGTTADLMKKAMVIIPKNIAQYMILQIHDELLFEIPATIANEYVPIIKKTMENILQLSIPLVVEIKIGNTWSK